MGNETDVQRWTDKVPMQDRRGTAEVTRYGSAHSGGFNVGLCDGSVRFISYSIDARTHRYLGNRSDGEVIEIPD